MNNEFDKLNNQNMSDNYNENTGNSINEESNNTLIVPNKIKYTMDDVVSMLGKATDLVTQNSVATSSILVEMNHHEKMIGCVSGKVDTLSGSMSDIDDRITNIEQSEEITTSQVENILTAVHRRIFEIIGNDEYEVHKYFRIFAQRLYSSARRNAGMGSSVSRTRKRDYQRVLDYVEAWEPRNGCTALKYEADVKAAARKMAKKNGYEC